MREPTPSRTPSPSVGSFQDMAARRPRQDDSVMHKIAPPTLPLPLSLRGSPHAIRDPTVPQLHVHVVDSIIPETEPDALSDDVQRLERRTKSRHDQPCEQKLTCGDDEVNGRLKRKKGHLRALPQEKDVRCTLQEGGLSQKRKASGPNSRRGAQSLPAVDSDADTVDFSSDEDDEGLESEDGFEETQTQRGKESQIDRFLREVDEDADRKNSSQRRGKKLGAPNRRSISTRTRSSQRARPGAA